MIDNHASDCAIHNEPAYPAGPCDCHLSKSNLPTGLFVTGPDADGDFWVHARAPNGKQGAVRVRGSGIVGEAFSAFAQPLND